MNVTTYTVPPVKCTSWCIEGTGHPDAEEAAEQACDAGEHRIELAATPMHLSDRAGGHVAVHLYRDVYSANGAPSRVILEPPHIEIYSSGTEVLALSIPEGRALGELLIALADIADGEDDSHVSVATGAEALWSLDPTYSQLGADTEGDQQHQQERETGERAVGDDSDHGNAQLLERVDRDGGVDLDL